jgi:hypothetical protein
MKLFKKHFLCELVGHAVHLPIYHLNEMFINCYQFFHQKSENCGKYLSTRQNCVKTGKVSISLSVKDQKHVKKLFMLQ